MLAKNLPLPLSQEPLKRTQIMLVEETPFFGISMIQIQMVVLAKYVRDVLCSYTALNTSQGTL